MSKLSMNATIKVVVDSNPKRKGSVPAGRFLLYKKAHTVQEYVDACKAKGHPRCVALADVLWDRERGFVAVGTGVRTRPITVLKDHTDA